MKYGTILRGDRGDVHIYISLPRPEEVVILTLVPDTVVTPGWTPMYVCGEIRAISSRVLVLMEFEDDPA